MFCSIERVIAPADAELESRQSDVGERHHNYTVEETESESRRASGRGVIRRRLEQFLRCASLRSHHKL